MKKYFSHFSIPIVAVLAVILIYPHSAHAAGWLDGVLNVTDLLLKPLGWISIFLLQIVTLLTYLSGMLLNYVADFTVVNMAANINGDVAANIKGIDIQGAWSTIRDVSNMGFIFILLYAGIQQILGIGKDTRKTIITAIVIAILINFSLFFTKVVIDTSNLLAMTFYSAMSPGVLDRTAPDFLSRSGIANSMMEPLKLTSIMEKAGSLDGKQLIIIGIFGSIFSLVASFVFVAVALMLIIRFVVLIFVMILSPLAFMGWILPQFKKIWDKWWDALAGQAFFAPIYFMLTWIVIKISNSLPTSGTLADAFAGTVTTGADGALSASASSGSIGLIMNFIVIIVFLVASLMIAKDYANKAGPIVAGMSKWAMGVAGGASFGLAGRLGRTTLGRNAEATLNNQQLLDKAKQQNMAGRVARLQLAASRKVAGSSFDARGTAPGGQLGAGKAAGTGGFAKYKKDKAEESKKIADSFRPSDEVIDQAEQKLEGARKADTPITDEEYREEFVNRKSRERSAQEAQEKAKEKFDEYQAGVSSGAIPYNAEVFKNHKDLVTRTQNELADAQRRASVPVSGLREDMEKERKQTKDRVISAAQAEVDKLKGVDDNRAKEMIREKMRKDGKNDTDINKFIGGDDGKAEVARLKKENKSAGDQRKEAYATTVERSIWAKIGGYNKAGAAAIRKSKSTKDKLVEAATALAKEEKDKEGGESGTTPTPTPSPSPSAPPPSTPPPSTPKP